MPYKDPEKAREAKRRYYQANRERLLELDRQYKEAHREEHNASSLRYYYANREVVREKNRAWREANPEKVRENMRRWRAAGGRPPWQRRRNAAVAELWDEQDGRCYLCEQPVLLEHVHLDHDHRCCPRLEFCSFCIRGVACRGCNHMVGNAGDDPARLELVARNLRVKLAEIDVRLANKPMH